MIPYGVFGKAEFVGNLLIAHSVAFGHDEALAALFGQGFHGGPEAGFHGGAVKGFLVAYRPIQVTGQRQLLCLAASELVNASVADSGVQPRFCVVNRPVKLPKGDENFLYDVLCRVGIPQIMQRVQAQWTVPRLEDGLYFGFP